MTALAAVVALAWTILAVRMLGRLGSMRPLRPIVASASRRWPEVDAVVPARNEERGVAATVAALLGQDYPGLTVTVIDDQSTDGTLAILEGLARLGDAGPARLRAVAGVERPSGWVGKTWAVHQGVSRTTAEWLWFVDADMGLHPRALATAMDLAEVEGADFVSIMPRVDCETFWQGTIATTLVQLLAQLYPLGAVNDPSRPTAIAAGGFILVRRAAYDRAGGHEAVRAEIVEDIQLARRVKSAGGRLAVRPAADLAWTHMFGSLGDIRDQMRKNAYAGMDYQPHKFFFGALAGVAMAWTPPVAVVAGLIGVAAGRPGSGAVAAVGLWGWLAQAATLAPVVAFLRLNPAFAFSLPAGLTAYIGIAATSVRDYYRGRVVWKGRAFDAATVSERRP